MARRRGEPTLRRLVAGVALPARSKAECAPDLRLSAASDAGAIVLLRIPQADPLRAASELSVVLAVACVRVAQRP